jgi:5-methylcytosine-specific restriction endonuclease McrA
LGMDVRASFAPSLLFPKFDPKGRILRAIDDMMDKRDAWRLFHTRSHSFIANKIVRRLVFERYEHKCAHCGSGENPSIDHILSVHDCYHLNKLRYCNVEENLQLLCLPCNIKKS